MANIYPFNAYRYSPKAGAAADLVTQPYDKITPEMRTHYLAASPYNVVRLILDNVYTRAAQNLDQWIAAGILEKDTETSLFAYFQEFTAPDTGERLVRKGFIGLGAVEDYSSGVVHRHEQTLSGPKKDRIELLRHTRAHCEQIFMLYPDPAGEVDRALDEAAAAAPDIEVTDEYGALHRVWGIGDAERIDHIRRLMADKKLLIADGHHRYETAIAFRDENPALAGADKVQMTFVNMHSPGLKILATHRLVSGLAGFEPRSFLTKASDLFQVEPASVEELQSRWASEQGLIGAAIGVHVYALKLKEAARRLDVRILHETLLGEVLGIGEEAVRDEKHLRYVRGMDAAVAAARLAEAQIAFLLKPTSIEQVAEVSFSGGVMPQKSTDFYPKLLSGLTIYKL